jgi:hypothetical protein
MALSDETLDAFGSLREPVGAVRAAVSSGLELVEAGDLAVAEPQIFEDAIRGVETAVDDWLDESGEAEITLLRNITSPARLARDPEAAEEAFARLAALQQVHVIVASMTAKLVFLDGIDYAEYRTGPVDARDAPDLFGEAFDLIVKISRRDENVRASSKATVVEDVVDAIVDQTGDATCALFRHGVPHAVVAHTAANLLKQAISLGSDRIVPVASLMVGRVARLVSRILRRVRHILNGVLDAIPDGVRTLLGDIISYVDLPKRGVTRLVGNVVLHAPSVKAAGSAAFASATTDQRRTQSRSLRKLEKSNTKWVGPVVPVSRGIPPLWTVPIGPVPAGAVAVSAMLARTVLISADQLDSYLTPDFWAGVLRITHAA